MSDRLPSSINYHITERCNYQCRFCFAYYHQYSKELCLKDSLKLIDILAEAGCKKLNFAGGEPTMISHLPLLINHAKKNNLFVSLISNGSGITEGFIESCKDSIDLIGLSIDSKLNSIEIALGRTLKKSYQRNSDFSHVDLINNCSKLIKKYGINLKINTVLTDLNWKEDLTKLILELNPIRWKILEVLYIKKINERFFNTHKSLRPWQIDIFKKKHQALNPIFESKDLIIDSYCMITPDGRFYQNSNHLHNYSNSILKIGVIKAFNQLSFSKLKYEIRDGQYFKRL